MSYIMVKNNFLYNVYVMCVALMLTLHIFNLGGGDTLKPFHIAAVIALLLSFFVIPLKGKLFKYTVYLVLCSLLSSLFSYSDTALPFWINLIVILLSCYGLSLIHIGKLLRWLFVLIPIDVAVLLFTATQGYTFRYQGFYDDPNYLCTTLMVFLLICFFLLSHASNKWAKSLMIVTIIGIYTIILMTVSRTGIVCSLLVLCSFFYNSLKKNIFKAVLIAVIAFVGVSYYARDFLGEQTRAFQERIFDSSDNYESAGTLRKELSLQNFRFIIDNPQYIFFGLGGGSSTGAGAAQIPGLNSYRKDTHGDHNTWTSTFSEQGLFAFVFFFLIIYTTYRNIIRVPLGADKVLLLAVFISIIIFSFSISQKVYLPFWWLLFFLNNESLKKKIELGS